MQSIRSSIAAAGGWLVLTAAPISPAAAEPPADVQTGASIHRAADPVGGDDRRRVADAGEPLYSALGRLTGRMVCTAAVVLHPRIIVTAGHCVAGDSEISTEPGVSFQPGYHMGESLGRFRATLWALGAPQGAVFQSIHDAANDWAILRLDGAPEGIHPLLLSDGTAKSAKALGRAALLPAYSADIAKAKALSVDAGCSVKDVLDEMLIHDCSGTLGSSGAPLLIRHRQWFAMLGIHTGSIFGSDPDGNVTGLIGNSAVGVWTFAEALELLLQRLNAEDMAAGATRHFY
jgi:V8-like Glu-specific endopeptidase